MEIFFSENPADNPSQMIDANDHCSRRQFQIIRPQSIRWGWFPFVFILIEEVIQTLHKIIHQVAVE